MQDVYADRSTTMTTIAPVAFPHGLNAPYMPSSQLSKNYVDIETFLYGIGANNYLSPTQDPSIPVIDIPAIPFYERPTLFIPRTEAYATNQRPNLN